jgi:hypothetical protein
LNHFCRSQEQSPRLPVESTLAHSLLPHNRWSQANPAAFAGGHLTTLHRHSALSKQRNVAVCCCCARPAQFDRGDEQWQGRAPPPPPPRQGPPTHSSPRLYGGEEARLIGSYSSGPLVGPRPVTAWWPARGTVPVQALGAIHDPTH